VLVERVVDANQVLVVVGLADRRGHVIVLARRHAGNVRQRHEREQLDGGGIDPVRGNHISGEWQPRQRIDERLLQKAEIAGALLRRRHDRLARLAAALAVPFE